MTPHLFVGKVVLAFTVTLVPALLIRYVIAGRAVGRWLSIGIAILLLFLNLIIFATGLPELKIFGALGFPRPRIPSGFEGLSSAVSYLILSYGRKAKASTVKPEKTQPRFLLHGLGFLLLLAGIIIGAMLVMNRNPGEFNPEQAWKNRTPLDEWRDNHPEWFARRATRSVADYLEDPFQAVADAVEVSVLIAVICLLSLARIGFPVAGLLGIGTIYVIALEAGAHPSQAWQCSFIIVLMMSLIIAGLMYTGTKLIQWLKPDIEKPQKAAEAPEVRADNQQKQ